MPSPLDQLSGPERRARLQRASYRCAWMIADMVRESEAIDGTRRSDTRLLDWLIPAAIVTVGRSDEYAKSPVGGRREHVIPRLAILQRCHAMVDREPLETIADFIARHTRIVMVSGAEQVLLDSRAGLNSRQAMPDDAWMTTGSAFARLEQAGIAWTKTPAYHHLQSDVPETRGQDLGGVLSLRVE